MTDPTPLEAQIAAVRSFAIATEQAATRLHCSYPDAAEFLMKLGPFLGRWNDADFRAKLDRYSQALTPSAPALTLVPQPPDRNVPS